MLSRPSRPRGLTLVELLVALALVALLASLAYPSHRGAVFRARRADALAALMQLQAAQERHRSQHPSYAGSVAALGLPAVTPGGHYALTVSAAGAAGYEAMASAQGDQTHDAMCRHLRAAVVGGQLVQASGPDGATSNAPADNRRCWGS